MINPPGASYNGGVNENFTPALSFCISFMLKVRSFRLLVHVWKQHYAYLLDICQGSLFCSSAHQDKYDHRICTQNYGIGSKVCQDQMKYWMDILRISGQTFHCAIRIPWKEMFYCGILFEFIEIE